MDFGGEGF